MPRSVSLTNKRQVRKLVVMDHRLEHAREALGVADLVLHMVIAFEDGEVALRVACHDGVAVLEVFLGTAELPERAALEILG